MSVSLLAGAVACAGAEKYAWRNVAIGGGGFVTGVEFHPGEKGLVYARTDVGGAYRWDAQASRWIALLDMFGQPDWNLQGVESLAIDPADTERVYVACGTYTQPLPEISNGAILRSVDRGLSWKRTDLPFKLGANEAGRGSGERLVVDPNHPERLYFGTRRDGLWYSDDRAATWSRLASFPDIPDESAKHPLKPGERFSHLAQSVGVVWVRVHGGSGKPGEITPVVYAAISRRGDSIFQSTDGGKTWRPVMGQPGDLRPVGAALVKDGTLYVTYADGPGPNQMRDGALWKYSPDSGAWTEVTPENPRNSERGFGYAGIGVDPADPMTVVVSSWNRLPFDEIFRSRDGGKSWQALLKDATWDHSSAPYTKTMSHHWLSDLEIDPYDRERLVFNTGYGIWISTNLQSAGPDRPSHWVFFNDGLEETVPLALISPPEGAHLISGVGDIDGFVHDDFGVSPPTGRFPAPGYKNTEWLDYAALQPRMIVRSGTTYQDDRINLALSRDGGRTWSALPTEPARGPAGRRHAIGPVAISADAGAIVFTPMGAAPFVTDDEGRSWRETTLPANTRVVGDRVQARTLYALDAAAGVLYLSRDAGKTFGVVRRSLALPPHRPWNPHFGDIKAVPGRAGEVWIAVGGKLYAFSQYGSVCTEFPLITGTTGVGFGRAAEGSDHPAVFVSGSVAGAHGIHRSDDGGKSWVRVNDDDHQFGAIGLITGDPRVFGRVYACTGGRGIICGEPVSTGGVSK